MILSRTPEEAGIKATGHNRIFIIMEASCEAQGESIGLGLMGIGHREKKGEGQKKRFHKNTPR